MGRFEKRISKIRNFHEKDQRAVGSACQETESRVPKTASA